MQGLIMILYHQKNKTILNHKDIYIVDKENIVVMRIKYKSISADMHYFM